MYSVYLRSLVPSTLYIYAYPSFPPCIFTLTCVVFRRLKKCHLAAAVHDEWSQRGCTVALHHATQRKNNVARIYMMLGNSLRFACEEEKKVEWETASISCVCVRARACVFTTEDSLFCVCICISQACVRKVSLKLFICGVRVAPPNMCVCVCVRFFKNFMSV